MGSTRRRYVTLLAVALLTLASTFAYLSLSTRRSARAAGVGAPAERGPYVTIFVLDGVSTRFLQDAISAGRAPNIQRMAAEGASVRSAVTAFPSITGYAFIPAITGQDAADSGVLGLRWWDRRRTSGPFRTYVGPPNVNMELDLSENLTTLFESFREQHGLSVLTYMGRGAHVKAKPAWPLITSKYDNIWWNRLLCTVAPFVCTSWEQLSDVPASVAMKDLQNRPKVQLVVFPSLDGYHHVYGEGPRFADMVPSIDKSIGDFVAESKRLGLEQERLYLIFGDHGMAEVRHNLQVTVPLERRHGLRGYRGPSVVFKSRLDAPLSSFGAYDVVECINGNLMDYVYLRHPARGWEPLPLPHDLLRAYPSRVGGGVVVDVPREFAEMEGVELVAFRGPAEGSVRVLDAGGEGELASGDGGETVEYRVVRGGDPMRLGLRPGEAPLRRAAAQWLNATAGAYYPYGAVRLWRLVRTRAATCGDVVLLSREGYDFGGDFELFTGNYRGGHGGLRSDNMLVPAWLNATAGAYYPYGAVRLWRLVRTRAATCGDVVLLSREGSDFGGDFELFTGNYRGGHGGLRSDNMLVPAVLYGPGVRRGASVEAAALEDVGATLVRLAGGTLGPARLRGRVIEEFLAEP
eukprot:m51a1_g6519 hypothetical protein (633) ;mRNA; r:275513-278219